MGPTGIATGKEKMDINILATTYLVSMVIYTFAYMIKNPEFNDAYMAEVFMIYSPLTAIVTTGIISLFKAIYVKLKKKFKKDDGPDTPSSKRKEN